MTTADQAAARRVTYQLETLWDYDYEPTHDELTTLYETAKKNQWNGSTAIDWSRPVGTEGPVLNVKEAFRGTNFFTRLTPDEQKEVEILSTNLWELKLLGMQMIVEGLAIAAFNVMRRQTADPTLTLLLDYVLQDEGRHVNFGYFALRRSIPAMDPDKRAYLEDFTVNACDQMYARDEHTGFRSIQSVWNEMGWDGEKIWKDTVANSMTTKHFNSFLFQDNLMPRLQRLGLISERVAPKYRALGLLA